MIVVSDKTEFKEKAVSKTKETCLMMIMTIIYYKDRAVMNATQSSQHSKAKTEKIWEETETH